MAHLLFPGVDSSIRYHHIESPKPSEDPLQNPWFPQPSPSQSCPVTENTRLESGRDPRHITEESIEENGDERIAHFEYYEGAEEFPIKVPPEQTAALISQSKTTNSAMAVLPGRCVRAFLDSFALIISLALVVLQFGLIDWYYLNVTGENVWAAWIGPDFVVLLILGVLGVLAIKYNTVQMEECCSIGKFKCL